MSLRIPMSWVSLIGSLAVGVAGACGPGSRPDNDAGTDQPDAEPDVIDAAPEIDGQFQQASKIYAHGNGNLEGLLRGAPAAAFATSAFRE